MKRAFQHSKINSRVAPSRPTAGSEVAVCMQLTLWRISSGLGVAMPLIGFPLPVPSIPTISALRLIRLLLLFPAARAAPAALCVIEKVLSVALGARSTHLGLR